MALDAYIWRAPASDEWLQAASDMNHCIHRYRSDRLGDYQRYDAYYHGEQNTRVLDRARYYLQASGFRWCENICDVVVDFLADRLVIDGFTATAEDVERDDLTRAVEECWEYSNGGDLQGTVHTEAAKLGDAFVIVGYDPEEGLPTYDFNGAEACKVVYSANNVRRRLYAVKVWCTDEESPMNPTGREIRRMNVYYPDRIEKYYTPTSDGKWLPYIDPTDIIDLPPGPSGEVSSPPVWPLPWTVDNTPFGEPRGIPVFHFANKRQKFPYGVSELHKAIPLQDAFNKHVLDVFEIADHMAWPQRWATGINQSETSSTSSTGRATVDTTPGSLWTTGNSEAKFGQFPAADMSNALRTLESDLQRFAAETRTPLYALWLTGQWPSGEALRTADGPLVKKAERLFPAFGSEWANVHAYGLGFYAAARGLALPEKVKVTPHWKDPVIRGDTERLQTVEGLVRLGLSKETALQMMGVNDADAELEKSDEEKEAAMDRSLRASTGGFVPPEE